MGFIHRHGPEPALPEMPGSLVTGIDSGGIAAVGVGDTAAQAFRISGHDDQVDMVGHQAPSPDLAAGLRQSNAQKITLGLIVGTTKETRFLPVSPLGDMVRKAGNDNAGETSHECIIISIIGGVNLKRNTVDQ